jgi:hypothetical protein
MHLSRLCLMALGSAGLTLAGCSADRSVTPASATGAGALARRADPLVKATPPPPTPCRIRHDVLIWEIDFPYTGLVPAAATDSRPTHIRAVRAAAVCKHKAAKRLPEELTAA